MTDDKIPPLPEPDAYRCIWFSGFSDDCSGWQQWHDDHDPLPDEWDEPPDEIEPYYSAAQHLAYARAYAAEQVRELVEALRKAEVGLANMLSYRSSNKVMVPPWEWDSAERGLDAVRALIAKHKGTT